MIAPSPTPIVIDIQGVTRRFGPTVALDDVSLRVPRGCVFGLIGVNGSGKTTLLKHVLGLLRAERGSVRIFGRDPVADPVGWHWRLWRWPGIATVECRYLLHWSKEAKSSDRSDTNIVTCDCQRD